PDGEAALTFGAPPTTTPPTAAPPTTTPPTTTPPTTAPPTTTPPTTAPPPPTSLPPSPPPVPPATAVVLNGTVEGPTSPGASRVAARLGAEQCSGTLAAWGAGRVKSAGRVPLVGAPGSITASLAGQVFGPSILGAPIDLTYTITGGTGAFKGATGSGKAVF